MIKTLNIEGLDLNSSESHRPFNIKRYYEKVYNTDSANFNICEAFDISVLEYLFNNFTFITHTLVNVPLQALKDSFNKESFCLNITVRGKPDIYFKFDDYIIIAHLVDRSNKNKDVDEAIDSAMYGGSDLSGSKFVNANNTKIHLSIHYPSNKLFEPIYNHLSFLEKYKIDDSGRNFVSVLIKNGFGEYDFEPLDIKVPKMKPELNYGKGFKEVYKKIIHKLQNNSKGLYMFHGDPGTGKSSFIRHLTTVVKKEFIFIPTTFIERFISDPDIFSILIRKKGCVLILEDAEKVLISREKEDNPFISTLLNISDGILSDILEASVVLTYNCDETQIDKALKRKGRTMVDYRFGKLNTEDAKALAKSLKFSKKQIEQINAPMTLTDIYNIDEENKYYEDDRKPKVIGFGA